jgi:hypothetical protein
MHRIRGRLTALPAIGLLSAVGACAALQAMIQPPIFEVVGDRTSEFRLMGPSPDRPLGGAQVRIWTRVQNPNTVGFTVTRLTGSLLLEGDRAAAVDLPLGLPLPAAGDTVVPLDVTLSFADVPGLANQIVGAVTGQRLDYAVEGIVGVDAGALGQPSFGPSTWLRGQVQVVR